MYGVGEDGIILPDSCATSFGNDQLSDDDDAHSVSDKDETDETERVNRNFPELERQVKEIIAKFKGVYTH